MLTSYTSSDEDISYLRIFPQNTRNNIEGPKLLENTADYHAYRLLCKLWERRPQVPDLVDSSPPPPLSYPLDWFLSPLQETFLQPVLKSFITVFIQYNEGLENKQTRAPFLGLAKSIYFEWTPV